MKEYTELDIWKKCRLLANAIYKLTANFPEAEKYGLVSQMRRASVSIVSNIAEGCGRNHNNEVLHFLSFSKGSLYELETQLYLCTDFMYINLSEFQDTMLLITECKQLINGFMNYYRKNSD